jgi:hypothetical protein
MRSITLFLGIGGSLEFERDARDKGVSSGEAGHCQLAGAARVRLFPFFLEKERRKDRSLRIRRLPACLIAQKSTVGIRKRPVGGMVGIA